MKYCMQFEEEEAFLKIREKSNFIKTKLKTTVQ